MNQHTATTGFKAMSELSVVICGIARDCAKPLAELIPKIEALGSCFSEYEIAVVENNSVDNTRKCIEDWSRENHRVLANFFTLSEDSQSSSSTGWFSEARVARISAARNRYIERLESISADYVLILDLDLLDFSLDGIADSFSKRESWHVSAGNGTRYTLRSPFHPRVYWDTYAFEPMGGFENGIQTLEFLRSQQRTLAAQLAKGEPVEALSAFGGVCIYRRECLKGLRYHVFRNDDPVVPVLCEHVAFHRQMRARNPQVKLLINPAQIVRYERLDETIKRSFKRALS